MTPQNVVASVEISANARNVRGVLADVERRTSRFAKTMDSVFERGTRSSNKSSGLTPLGNAFGNVGARVMERSFDFLVDAGRQALAFEDRLQRLGISSGSSAADMAAFGKAARRAGEEVGLSGEEVLSAAEEYVKLTGDMGSAKSSMDEFAAIAQASNSNMKDIATSAAAMQQGLNIDPADFQAGFSALITQGKAGSVELKDMAAELAGIAPLMAGFKGGTGLGGLRELGAAMQVIRQGFGTSSEAATGFQALVVSITRNGRKLEKQGVKVFDKDPKTGVRTLRNFSEIVASIGNSKLMKSPTKLVDALGSVEAFRAFEQLRTNKALMEDLVVKGRDAGAVQRDLQRYMESGPGKVARAWEKAKNIIADAFTPERMEMFANAAVKAGEAFAAAVRGATDLVDGIQSIAKTAAKLIGGKSWEDQVSDIQADRLIERRKFLEGKGMSADKAMSRIVREDRLQDTMLGHKTSGVTGKAFTLDELLTLRKDVIPGTSDEKRLMQVNTDAMVRTLREGFESIARTIQTPGVGGTFAKPGGPEKDAILVKVGNDTIFRAERSAPAHRSRPGGR